MRNPRHYVTKQVYNRALTWLNRYRKMGKKPLLRNIPRGEFIGARSCPLHNALKPFGNIMVDGASTLVIEMDIRGYHLSETDTERAENAFHEFIDQFDRGED